MDRIALGIVTSGLALIVALVVTVLSQPASVAVPGYAAVAASFAGLSIVAGLILLERQTKGPFAHGAAAESRHSP